MAHVIKDRVKVTSTTTGTGTYTLGTAVTGFVDFSVIGNGNTTYYCATDGTDWEVGVGTYTSAGTTLARTTILASSNAGAAVNWAAGTRTIFCDAPAKYLPSFVDPGADRILFFDDSDDKIQGLTLAGGLSISGTVLTGTGIITDSQQPASDVISVTSTGFLSCKTVQINFAFTQNDATHTYTIGGRVSGGTWRNIFSFDGLGDATSAIAGFVTIANFGVATEKIAFGQFFTSGSVLDSSDAANVQSTAAAAIPAGTAFLSWDEIWDEVRITADSGTPIEGSTADQRGRWFVTGWL